MILKLTGDYETDVNLLIGDNLKLKNHINEEATKLNRLAAKINEQTFEIKNGDMEAMTGIYMRMWAMGMNIIEAIDNDV